MNRISELVSGLYDSNDKSAYKCLKELELASEKDSSIYSFFDIFAEMLNNSNVSEEQKAIITQEITNVNKEKNAIMVCENLITTKGFSNCVIFVNTDSVSVVVEDDNLKSEEIAQIQNIISREMNAKVENIHIMTKK